MISGKLPALWKSQEIFTENGGGSGIEMKLIGRCPSRHNSFETFQFPKKRKAFDARCTTVQGRIIASTGETQQSAGQLHNFPSQKRGPCISADSIGDDGCKLPSP
eukprot:g37212.t1